jgi:uncharacterized protein YraI
MQWSKLLRYLMMTVLLAVIMSPVLAQDASVSGVTAETFRNINVRSGPSTDFEIVDQLEEGSVVNVIGRSDQDSNWLLVEYDGKKGWVAYFTVSITGDTETLAIAQPEGTATLETPTPAAPPSEPVNGARSDLYVSAYRRVNVRTGPGTEFRILGVLAPGDTADIVGTSGDDAEWLEIDFEGQNGWVAYFVVHVSGDLAGIDTAADVQSDAVALPPIENFAAASLSIDVNQVVIITRFNTNLREAPTFDSNIVDVIPFETTLSPEARTADNNWLRVTYDGNRGWLIASLVNMGVSDITALPVETAS